MDHCIFNQGKTRYKSAKEFLIHLLRKEDAEINSKAWAAMDVSLEYLTVALWLEEGYQDRPRLS